MVKGYLYCRASRGFFEVVELSLLQKDVLQIIQTAEHINTQ